MRAGRKVLAVVVTGGQRGDSPQFIPVLSKVRVARPGSGRPRSRPERVLADKAYTSTANRAYLRRRGIKGGRPPAFDPITYLQRHAVERGNNNSNNTAPWPPVATS
jgi:hypothetical protein